MRHEANPDFHDRLNDAAKAREDLLAKLRAAPRPDDPVMIEKRRERQAIAKARAARQAERERARGTQEEAALKAEQKTARDARYAARKAAKKERRKGTGRAARGY